MLILEFSRSSGVQLVGDFHRSLDRAMNPSVTPVDVVHMESVFLSETRLWKSFLHPIIGLKAQFTRQHRILRYKTHQMTFQHWISKFSSLFTPSSLV